MFETQISYYMLFWLVKISTDNGEITVICIFKGSKHATGECGYLLYLFDL